MFIIFKQLWGVGDGGREIWKVVVTCTDRAELLDQRQCYFSLSQEEHAKQGVHDERKGGKKKLMHEIPGKLFFEILDVNRK